GLASAEGIEGVEADFHPLAQADGLDVIDRHAILQRHTCDISTQRQTAFGRQTPKINGYAAAHFRFDYRARVSQCRAIEFTISHQHDLADHLDDGVALALGKTFKRWWASRQFVGQRDLAAADEESVMIENLSDRLSVASSRERRVAERPAQGDAQRFVQFGFLRIRQRQMLEAT